MKVVKKPIPEKLFEKIHRLMPVVCVDIVVASRNDKGKKVFSLVKRKNPPKAGAWWFPGGRIYKNETLKNAALRKLAEETGLRGKVAKQLGFHEWFCKKGYFKGADSHTIIFVFLIDVGRNQKILLDSQSSSHKQLFRIPKNLDPYLKKFLKLAGFKE